MRMVATYCNDIRPVMLIGLATMATVNMEIIIMIETHLDDFHD